MSKTVTGDALPLEDLVTCVICQEIYKDPTALRCLHTLCQLCIDHLKRRSMVLNCIQCPICRESSDTRYLKHDFRVKNLVDIYHSQSKIRRRVSVEINENSCCQLCSKQAFRGKCVDCDKLICDSCLAAHNSIPSCEGHTVISLGDMLGQCSFDLAHIDEVLLRDRDILNDKLHSLEEYLRELSQLKHNMTTALKTSENAVIDRIRLHYASLYEDLANSITENKLKANQAKGQILEVMGEVMNRSRVVVDALSGTEAVSLLQKVHELNVQNEIIQSDDFLILPKLEMALLQSPHWDTYDLNNIVSITTKSTPNLLCGAKSNKPKLDLNFNDVLLNSEETLNESEKSSLRYKFKYFKQVSVMLNELRANLEAYARDTQCENVCSLDMQSKMSTKKACMVSPSVSLRRCTAPRRFTCEQILAQATQLPLQTHREITLAKCDEPQNLIVVSNEIWCIYQDWVNVYDFDLVFRSRLSRDHLGTQGERLIDPFLNMKAMVRAHTGHYFQACDAKGLRVLRTDLSRFRELRSGNICDVIAEGELVCALDAKTGEILIFAHQQIPEMPYHYRDTPWKLERSIKCQCALSIDDTMALVNDVFYVCSYRNDSIYRYHSDGTLLATTQVSPSRKGPGHLWRPRICCKTTNGSLLIADHYHNRLQVLTPEKHVSEGNGAQVANNQAGVPVRSHTWQVLHFDTPLNFPWSAVLHSSCGLVVLEKCNWKHKLLQFVLPSPDCNED